MLSGDDDDFLFGDDESAGTRGRRQRPSDDVDFDFGFVDGSGQSGEDRGAATRPGGSQPGSAARSADASGGSDGEDFDFDFEDITEELPAPRARVGPLEVLTVCTHNRTRSVMSMAMLQAGFDEALGSDAVRVRSLGFGPEGIAAIPDAVQAMKRRGLDVSEHRSRQVTAGRLTSVDLVLTSERDHVVKIAAMAPDVFQRTFTLPEFCQRLAFDPTCGSRTFTEWVSSLSSARSATEYLSAAIPEVSDPTGLPHRQFEGATEGIETMCSTVVEIVSRSIG